MNLSMEIIEAFLYLPLQLVEQLTLTKRIPQQTMSWNTVPKAPLYFFSAISDV